MDYFKPFDEMTIAELREYLSGRGRAGDGDAMKFNTKTRKADLIEIAYRADVLAVVTATPPGDALVGGADRPLHMLNSERVKKYTWQNFTSNGGCARRNNPVKLTHRQMRRVRKNANKHGEGFVYATPYAALIEEARADGHSLLARTPEGLGIFHRLARSPHAVMNAFSR